MLPFIWETILNSISSLLQVSTFVEARFSSKSLSMFKFPKGVRICGAAIPVVYFWMPPFLDSAISGCRHFWISQILIGRMVLTGLRWLSAVSIVSDSIIRIPSYRFYLSVHTELKSLRIARRCSSLPLQAALWVWDEYRLQPLRVAIQHAPGASGWRFG